MVESVRIQSSTTFKKQLFTINCLQKRRKEKGNEVGNGLFGRSGQCEKLLLGRSELESFSKMFKIRAVVVAQLVEQLRPTPKFRGSNPIIGTFV